MKINVTGSEAMDIISALKKASNQDEKDGFLYTARESLWTAKLFVAAVSDEHRPTFEGILDERLERINGLINGE